MSGHSVCNLHVDSVKSVGFLKIIWFPPAVQNRQIRLIGDSIAHRCVVVCLYDGLATCHQ